jgi:ketosteroid isomerase-like protein
MQIASIRYADRLAYLCYVYFRQNEWHIGAIMALILTAFEETSKLVEPEPRRLTVNAPESSHLATATTAMRHWAAGAADGDFSRLVAMLEPDVTFHVPVPGFSGVQHGITAARRFFDHLSAVLRADLAVTATLRDDTRTGFEVSVDGSMNGRRFVQALCLVFVVRDGRVRAFREYVAWPGGLAPTVGAGHGDL